MYHCQPRRLLGKQQPHLNLLFLLNLKLMGSEHNLYILPDALSRGLEEMSPLA